MDEKKGRSVVASALLLASVVGGRPLLAFLLSSPQEVARGPAHRVRHPAAYRFSRGYLVDMDLVVLHPRQRSAGGLRRPAAHAGHRLLHGQQGFFALPEGHTEQLAALPISQGYEPLEPLHLPQLGQGLLLEMALCVVYPVRSTLYRGYPCVHAAPPSVVGGGRPLLVAPAKHGAQHAPVSWSPYHGLARGRAY